MVFTVNLEELKEVVDAEQTISGIDKLNKFQKLFGLMKTFLKKRKIILYGGTAMNLHLPDHSKIYTDEDFPDFDCFSLNPKKDSEDLANIFSKNNYKYIEIKHAIHDGTYKLYVDFEPVLDMTKISKANHDVLLREACEIDGYYVTSIKHLKSALYLELAIPQGALFRWQKVVQRVKLMESEFKNNKSSFSIKNIQFISFNKNINNTIALMRSYAIENGMVLAGNDAIEYHLGEDDKEHCRNGLYMLTTSTGLFQCLSTNMKPTVDYFKKIIEKAKFKNVVVKEEKHDFITPYTKIFVSYYDDTYTFEKFKLNICTVFAVDEHCYSFVKSNSVKYASIFYVLHILYYSLYKNKEDDIDKVNIKNIINSLVKRININSFKTECYGSEKTMNEIRRQRWDDNKPVVLLRLN